MRTARIVLPVALSLMAIRCNWLPVDEQAKLQPVIEALENYRKEKGRFPDQLSKVVPMHLAELPDIGKAYKYKKYRNQFTISYKNSETQSAAYLSGFNRWYISDEGEWPE